MKNPLSVLLRVKELREDQAFRAVMIKRRLLVEAVAEEARAQAEVDASSATLRAREDAIYAEILRKIVDLGAVETTKGKVLLLEKQHGLLLDARDRAAHVVRRRGVELEAAVKHHRQCQKNRDKYVIITDEINLAAAELVVFKEEAEVEDTFSTRRKAAI